MLDFEQNNREHISARTIKLGKMYNLFCTQYSKLVWTSQQYKIIINDMKGISVGMTILVWCDNLE